MISRTLYPGLEINVTPLTSQFGSLCTCIFRKSKRSFRLINYSSRPLKSRRTVMELQVRKADRATGMKALNSKSTSMLQCPARSTQRCYNATKMQLADPTKSRPKTYGILSQEQNDLAPFIPLHPQAPPEFLLLLSPAQSNA